ncbi:MAG: SDR family NAD(P)-dependent oxidoreductase [Gemmatimonadota bacterium]
MPAERSLEGRGAVVTGGGRGIGAAIARALVAAGAGVVVAARSEEQIERVAGELREAGGQAWAVPCDVADRAAVDALAGAATQRLGHVDILVNNAGVGHSAAIKDLSLEDWTRVLAVNATGTYLCTRAFLGPMMERGWGRVVNVASVAGVAGARYIAAYSASKHAVVGFTRCAAIEAAPRGVTVNAVCPAFVDTDMARGAIERVAGRTGLSEEDALGAVLATTRQPRLILPDEVAHAVLCLCEEEARAINGQAIVMDAGAGLG